MEQVIHRSPCGPVLCAGLYVLHTGVWSNVCIVHTQPQRNGLASLLLTPSCAVCRTSASPQSHTLAVCFVLRLLALPFACMRQGHPSIRNQEMWSKFLESLTKKSLGGLQSIVTCDGQTIPSGEISRIASLWLPKILLGVSFLRLGQQNPSNADWVENS